jgi:hypothetical protein
MANSSYVKIKAASGEFRGYVSRVFHVLTESYPAFAR